MKTDGELQRRMTVLAKPAALALIATITIVSIWTPLAHPDVAQRWFSLPNLLFFAPVPLLVLLVTVLLIRSLSNGYHAAPFMLALCLLFLGYSGLAISLWPNIVPPFHFNLASSKSASIARLHARRRAFHYPLHPDLHFVVLLPSAAVRSGPARAIIEATHDLKASTRLGKPAGLARDHLGSERRDTGNCRAAVPVADEHGRTDDMSRRAL